jgi:hypothetical protein
MVDQNAMRGEDSTAIKIKQSRCCITAVQIPNGQRDFVVDVVGKERSYFTINSENSNTNLP